MPAAGASVQGQDELVRSLDAAARELAQLDEADDHAGQLLAGAVAAEAPRRSGFLAGSIEHTGAAVRVGAPYGVFVHARDPFAARAMEQRLQEVTDLYGQAVALAVAKVKGS